MRRMRAARRVVMPARAGKRAAIPGAASVRMDVHREDVFRTVRRVIRQAVEFREHKRSASRRIKAHDPAQLRMRGIPAHPRNRTRVCAKPGKQSLYSRFLPVVLHRFHLVSGSYYACRPRKATECRIRNLI